METPARSAGKIGPYRTPALPYETAEFCDFDRSAFVLLVIDQPIMKLICELRT